MPVILIADACKPSLVMSSEVFKDKIAGATILVASTGKQCLELLLVNKPDMCVVDFDLPDADGVTLITAMRKSYRGPILLTAYPDKIVEQAVHSDLFAFNDAGGWVPKPVKFAPRTAAKSRPAAAFVRRKDSNFDFGFNKPRKAKKPKGGGAAGGGS